MLKRDSEHSISVVINTYNAERLLEEVILSVSGFDEVVVCDMESTDRTVEIATHYGCKIVTFPKADHKSAEPARTFAIQSASSKWVLVVDADEVVTPQLRDYLYARIGEEDCPAGLYIPRKGYFMHRLFAYPDYQLRFFIREGTVWPPYVHTFPKVNGVVGYIPEKRAELALIHKADDSIHTVLYKTNEYTDNEVEKKKNRKYGTAALIFRPLWCFVRSYIVKGKIRKGVPGLISSVLDSHYQFVVVSKIIERRNADNGLNRNYQ